jgi:hypothetical protein
VQRCQEAIEMCEQARCGACNGHLGKRSERISRPDAGAETATVDVRDETAIAAALLGAYGAVNAVSL